MESQPLDHHGSSSCSFLLHILSLTFSEPFSVHVIDVTTVTNKAHGVHTLQRVKSLNLDTLIISSKSSTLPQAIIQTSATEVILGNWWQSLLVNDHRINRINVTWIVSMGSCYGLQNSHVCWIDLKEAIIGVTEVQISPVSQTAILNHLCFHAMTVRENGIIKACQWFQKEAFSSHCPPRSPLFFWPQYSLPAAWTSQGRRLHRQNEVSC